MRTKSLLLFLLALPLGSVTVVGQEKEKIDYIPQVYGVVKARYEVSTDTGDMRFSVRNTRLGVKGNASRNMKYAMQIELNSLGNFSVLDAFATYGAGNFSLSVGQQPFRFSTENNRGAGGNYFANRSFLAKFVTRYYSDGEAFDIGSRDIGGMADYVFDWDIPVKLNAGIFNGSGLNNPQWDDHVNFIGRIDVGAPKGFAVSASYYGGKSPLGDKMWMWGAEARYISEKLIVEGEFAMRYLNRWQHTDVLTVAVVHAMYIFPLRENPLAKSIIPQLRWDMGDNIKFENLKTNVLDDFDAQRLTAGLCIGLTDGLLKSELRFNYEYFFGRLRPSDFYENQLLQNKFSIEFFARF